MRKNTAQTIREALKAKGITARQVSVRSDRMGADIKVKDLTVDIEAVRKLANSLKPELSSSIYLTVTYDFEAVQKAKALPEYQALKEAVAEKLKGVIENHGVEIAPGFVAFLYANKVTYQATVAWKPEKYWHFYQDADDIAFEILVAQATGKFKAAVAA